MKKYINKTLLFGFFCTMTFVTQSSEKHLEINEKNENSGAQKSKFVDNGFFNDQKFGELETNIDKANFFNSFEKVVGCVLDLNKKQSNKFDESFLFENSLVDVYLTKLVDASEDNKKIYYQ